MNGSAEPTADGHRLVANKLSAKEIPSVCLSAFLLGRLVQHKDKHLIVDCTTGCLWTGKEIHDCCLSIADAFLNLFDLNPGDSVCFWCDNSDVHAIAFLATVATGANYVPIDPDYSLEDVYKVVKLSSAKFLVCNPDYTDTALKIMNEIDSLQRVFVISGGTGAEAESEEPTNCHYLMDYMRYKSSSAKDPKTKPMPIPVPVRMDDMCVIQFVKQQSKDGKPYKLRPIIKTNANLIHSAYQLHHSDLFQWTADQCLAVRHFSDYLGLSLFCHCLVSGNKVALLSDRFNRQQSMQSLAKYQINCVSLDLKELFYLLRHDVEIRSSRVADEKSSHNYHDFTTLTDILYTGPPLPHPDMLREELFRKIKPEHFRAIYCRPETGLIACCLKSYSTFDRLTAEASVNCFGNVVPGVELKVIHPKTCKARKTNKMGEIVVRTKQMISSATNLSLVTADAFTDEGFFRTGDAGYYDADGRLYIECRVDECIYEGTEVINPYVLESMIEKHSLVKDVAVIGVPDPTLGQICCAFVVLENGVPQSLAEPTLHEYLSGRGRQLRAGIRYLASMPLTNRSQANRMALRMIYDNLHNYSMIEML